MDQIRFFPNFPDSLNLKANFWALNIQQSYSPSNNHCFYFLFDSIFYKVRSMSSIKGTKDFELCLVKIDVITTWFCYFLILLFSTDLTILLFSGIQWTGSILKYCIFHLNIDSAKIKIHLKTIDSKS